MSRSTRLSGFSCLLHDTVHSYTYDTHGPHDIRARIGSMITHGLVQNLQICHDDTVIRS